MKHPKQDTRYNVVFGSMNSRSFAWHLMSDPRNDLKDVIGSCYPITLQGKSEGNYHLIDCVRNLLREKNFLTVSG